MTLSREVLPETISTVAVTRASRGVKPFRRTLSRSCPSVGTEGMKTPAGSRAALAQGVWGGDHVRMEVGDGEVAIEFDCAHASLPERPKLDEQGRFQSIGLFVEGVPALAEAALQISRS